LILVMFHQWQLILKI